MRWVNHLYIDVPVFKEGTAGAWVLALALATLAAVNHLVITPTSLVCRRSERLSQRPAAQLQIW